MLGIIVLAGSIVAAFLIEMSSTCVPVTQAFEPGARAYGIHGVHQGGGAEKSIGKEDADRGTSSPFIRFLNKMFSCGKRQPTISESALSILAPVDRTPYLVAFEIRSRLLTSLPSIVDLEEYPDEGSNGSIEVKDDDTGLNEDLSIITPVMVRSSQRLCQHGAQSIMKLACLGSLRLWD